MKLYEYEAKKILKEYQIPVPSGVVLEQHKGINKFLFPDKSVVLKAQVLTGGRGKAGGVRFANSMEEFQNAYQKLLSIKIKDLPVKKILVEEKLDIKSELYLGYSILRSEAKIIFMISEEGGMEIEELARDKPDSIIKYPIDILEGFEECEIKKILKNIKFDERIINEIENIALALYKIFTEYECDVAEINPLAITYDNKVIAADARISIYDEAIFKHPEYEKEEDTYTLLEKKARRIGLGYVEMNGNIGVIGNGAGLNMATLDILTYFGGNPANFLEVSGRTYHKAKEAIEIILSKPNVKIIFGNFFGCISRCDVIAKGLDEAIRSGVIKVPIVIAMRGTGAEEGIKTLKEAGLEEIFEDDIDAGKRVADILRRL